MQRFNESSVFRTAESLLTFAGTYRGVGGKKQEVEILFYVPCSGEDFVEAIRKSFEVVGRVSQHDSFLDKDGLLGLIDAYLRARTEISTEGRSFELKAAHPGLFGKPSIRPATDERLDEEGFKQRLAEAKERGFCEVRAFRKDRIECHSLNSFLGRHVGLEVDHFSNVSENKSLAGRTFVSFSIEIEGNEREEAEKALELAISETMKVVPLIECRDANYEAYYFGHKKIPSR